MGGRAGETCSVPVPLPMPRTPRSPPPPPPPPSPPPPPPPARPPAGSSTTAGQRTSCLTTAAQRWAVRLHGAKAHQACCWGRGVEEQGARVCGRQRGVRRQPRNSVHRMTVKRRWCCQHRHLYTRCTPRPVPPATLACRVCLQEALRFAERLAMLCERHCTALQDFTGARAGRGMCTQQSVRVLLLSYLGPQAGYVGTHLHGMHRPCSTQAAQWAAPLARRPARPVTPLPPPPPPPVCPALPGERKPPLAIDVGCAVGGATFELARAFPHVLGIDYSQTFVNTANVSSGARPPCGGPALCCPRSLLRLMDAQEGVAGISGGGARSTAVQDGGALGGGTAWVSAAPRSPPCPGGLTLPLLCQAPSPPLP